MRTIDADLIQYEPMLSPKGNGQYEEVSVAYKSQIDDLPTIEERKTGKWISCSERLPDMHDEVLVTARGEVSIAWLYVDGKWRSNDMPQPMLRDIIAWKPLPEPYKGEQE